MVRRLRRPVQGLSLAAFLLLLVATRYGGTDEIAYPVRLFLDIDPLVMLGTLLSAGAVPVAFLASLLSIAIGVPMGAIAGYFGGLVDEIIVWLYSTLSSIPGFLLILAFAFVLRERLPGITSVYVALGLTSWVGLCRLMRGEVLKHKNRDYVAAAMVYGASRPRIIFKHIIPNVTHLILIDFSLRFVGFVHAEVILSYLGLGPKEQPSWGTMINEAKQELTRNPSVWWQLAAAAVAVLILSLALNVAGDAMRDALDPKLRHVA